MSAGPRGNLWVCFISESEAVEKLQTPRLGQRGELGSDSRRAPGSHGNCGRLSSQLCGTFTLTKFSLLHLEFQSLPTSPVPFPLLRSS